MFNCRCFPPCSTTRTWSLWQFFDVWKQHQHGFVSHLPWRSICWTMISRCGICGLNNSPSSFYASLIYHPKEVAIAFVEENFSAELSAYRRARRLADLRNPQAWFSRKMSRKLSWFKVGWHFQQTKLIWGRWLNVLSWPTETFFNIFFRWEICCYLICTKKNGSARWFCVAILSVGIGSLVVKDFFKGFVEWMKGKVERVCRQGWNGL